MCTYSEFHLLGLSCGKQHDHFRYVLKNSHTKAVCWSFYVIATARAHGYPSLLRPRDLSGIRQSQSRQHTEDSVRCPCYFDRRCGIARDHGTSADNAHRSGMIPVANRAPEVPRWLVVSWGSLSWTTFEENVSTLLSTQMACIFRTVQAMLPVRVLSFAGEGLYSTLRSLWLQLSNRDQSAIAGRIALFEFSSWEQELDSHRAG